MKLPVPIDQITRLLPTLRRIPDAPQPPAETDPLSEARLHKRRVRAAATARVAQLALLFLVDPDHPTSAEAEYAAVTAAWTQAKAELSHQHFVRTQPATVADLYALAG